MNVSSLCRKRMGSVSRASFPARCQQPEGLLQVLHRGAHVFILQGTASVLAVLLSPSKVLWGQADIPLGSCVQVRINGGNGWDSLWTRLDSITCYTCAVRHFCRGIGWSMCTRRDLYPTVAACCQVAWVVR